MDLQAEMMILDYLRDEYGKLAAENAIGRLMVVQKNEVAPGFFQCLIVEGRTIFNVVFDRREAKWTIEEMVLKNTKDIYV